MKDRCRSHAKQALGLPESTPVIVTGDSRGAGLAVFASAEPNLRKGVIGAVARIRGKSPVPRSQGGWRELEGPDFR